MDAIDYLYFIAFALSSMIIIDGYNNNTGTYLLESLFMSILVMICLTSIIAQKIELEAIDAEVEYLKAGLNDEIN